MSNINQKLIITLNMRDLIVQLWNSAIIIFCLHIKTAKEQKTRKTKAIHHFLVEANSSEVYIILLC